MGPIDRRQTHREKSAKMAVHCFESSNEVDALTGPYQHTHGLSFGLPGPDLGQARVATQANGSVVGIRDPLAADEQPIVGTYFAVEVIQHVVKKAGESGATIAYPPNPPGQPGQLRNRDPGRRGTWTLATPALGLRERGLDDKGELRDDTQHRRDRFEIEAYARPIALPGGAGR
jgi:hypothetical protein